MKKIFTLFVIMALTISVFAQSPQKISYQAVVRNASGVLQANQAVGMKISILQGSETGIAVYVETQTKTTNANGLVTLEIGSGTIITGSFSGIDWSNGTYFIKTETDPAGGTNYTITGSNQILSVPYALYSKVAKTANYNDLLNKPTTLSGYGITDAVTTSGNQTISGTTTFKGTTPDIEEALFEVKNKDGQTILAVYNEGVRIWVSDGAKGTKGGFAVGGFDMTKGITGDYFNVSARSEADTINGESRVMWYPVKEAFRSGKVLIESKDSVGTNSWASGFKSKAIGDWSQALGFQTIARGDYSTAIGKNAIAGNINSFAFGESAAASNDESYAFGRGAIASGYRSFAFGSAGIDTAGVPTDIAQAIGDYAFAIGQGSKSTGMGSFSIGIGNIASGQYSTAIGYKTAASGRFALTLGLNSSASGYISTAMGFNTLSSGNYSIALGCGTIASGHASFATGTGTIANNSNCVAFGNSTIAGYGSDFAMGYHTKAYGGNSVAMGSWSKAKGSDSFAANTSTVASASATTSLGFGTLANSFATLVIGMYNDTTCSSLGWNQPIPTDPLFACGNGTWLNRKNAFTVYKNGNAYIERNLGIGISTPSQKLHVNGDIRLEGGGIQNLSGGVGVGFTSTGWYSDVGNLATRIPSATGDLYVQTPGGASTILRVGPGIGGMELFVGKAVFDNAVGIATSSVGTYKLYVNGTAYSTGGWSGSDFRWKKNILPLNNLLSGIQQLIPVSYEWRRDEYPEINFDEGRQFGLIAQEVEKVFPELVRTDDNDYKAVSYEKLTVVLLEAIKEQQTQINELKALVNKLMSEK